MEEGKEDNVSRARGRRRIRSRSASLSSGYAFVIGNQSPARPLGSRNPLQGRRAKGEAGARSLGPPSSKFLPFFHLPPQKREKRPRGCLHPGGRGGHRASAHAISTTPPPPPDHTMQLCCFGSFLFIYSGLFSPAKPEAACKISACGCCRQTSCVCLKTP